MSGGVLISGGTQPLGTRIAERLLDAGQGPVLLIGAEAPGEVWIPRGALYWQVDLTRARHVRRLLYGPCLEHGVRSLINLAFHRDPKTARAHALNVGATRQLLLLAEEHPTLERFVHWSASEVYVQRNDQPDLLREDQPLNLDPRAPHWVRDRVEADVTVCARMGLSPGLTEIVLRCAEILTPDMGSQLYDYLSSRICLRPMGYDPMVEVLSLEDAARAFQLALHSPQSGAFNIPGAENLPLSRLIRLWGRDDIPVPGPLIGPLYALRRVFRHRAFRYRANTWRFHFNGVLDGARAAQVLGYTPEHPVDWPALREPQQADA
jgi:UDP-glucose 4-epimerase